MTKRSMISFCLLILLLFGGCSDSFTFPNENDFTLKVEVNKTILKIGEELIIKGIFKNHTRSNYKLVNSSASFSKSGLIHLEVYKLDEEETIFVGASRSFNIEGKQEVFEISMIEIDQIGKYKVVAISNFDIINKDKKEKYHKKSKPIYIEVE